MFNRVSGIMGYISLDKFQIEEMIPRKDKGRTVRSCIVGRQ